MLEVDKKTHVSTQTYGTVAYMPPELLSSSRLTKAVRPQPLPHTSFGEGVKEQALVQILCAAFSGAAGDA